MKPNRRSSLSATNSNDDTETPSHSRRPVPNSDSEIPKTHFTKLSSLSLKSVTLYDWWLARADDGKGLAVSGLASKERVGGRAFHSSPIVKRLNATTLETADGITVTISGFINRSHTHTNGFPLEVCSHFQLGFPHYWEEYAGQCWDQEHSDEDIPTSSSCSTEIDPLQQFSLFDIPVTRIRDSLISRPVDSETCALGKRIVSETLRKYGSTQHKTPNHKKAKVDMKTCAFQHKTPNHKKAKVDMKTCAFQNGLTTSRGVITRSMARLMNLRNTEEENFPSRSSVDHKNNGLLPPEVSGFRSIELLSRSGSKWYKAKTFSEKNKEPRGCSNRSAVRRLIG